MRLAASVSRESPRPPCDVALGTIGWLQGNMLLGRIAGLLLATLALGEEAPAQQEARLVLAPADLDATIQALPPVDAEIRVAQDGRWLCDPAVERLRRHLEAGGTLDGEQWVRALARERVLR